MKEIEALIRSLEDTSGWDERDREYDLNTILGAIYRHDIYPCVFVPPCTPSVPPTMLILAKMLQRIDKLEDEIHELRSRID